MIRVNDVFGLPVVEPVVVEVVGVGVVDLLTFLAVAETEETAKPVVFF